MNVKRIVASIVHDVIGHSKNKYLECGSIGKDWVALQWFVLGDFGDFSVFKMKESGDWMIKINYFNDKELLVRRCDMSCISSLTKTTWVAVMW